MHVICPGCGETFMRSGLAHHIRQSNNPHCQLPRGHERSNTNIMDDVPPTPDSAPAAINSYENGPLEHFQLGVDPAGDLFGDYSHFTDADFGMNDGEEQDLHEPFTEEDDPERLAEIQDEEEIALVDALLAEEEQRLEPERPSQSAASGIADEEPEQSVLPGHRPFRLRGGEEEPLANHPEITKFSVGNAGAVYERTHRNGNQGYHRADSNADNSNPYEPFSSKLDWEIACWAKTRGPGSNALTELLSINGVSFPYHAKYIDDLLI